jgi:hypothetical protein
MARAQDIECRMLLSVNGTHEAGRIRLTGIFDDSIGEERLTSKLPFAEYRRLVHEIETFLGVRN